ncbi:1-acyl-sn-glycerol-3-phosphate acyltransferase [Pseudonocardiaceae bacterium YIM PH 21723]|nr:1-acyl-sn-glycerol-3-phosphate acyltransferase [Pseudonocardiaceae bacterium YIM PH 21723]
MAKREEHGRENVPRTGPVLFAANHTSYLDPIYDATFVHLAGRVPRFLGKASLFDIPLLGHMLKGSGGIPVYRGTADAKESLRAAIKSLSEDKLVIIYPEGTVTKDPDWWPMAPKTGVARLALESGAPVIPVARIGTHEVYDHYKKKFTPFPRKTVKIRAGKPVDLSAYLGKEITNQLLREVSEVISQAILVELAILRGKPAPKEYYTVPKTAE